MGYCPYAHIFKSQPTWTPKGIEKMAVTIQQIVDKQVEKVLREGARLGSFDQIRQRHFWSSYLFIANPTNSKVAAGAFDIFKTIPGGSGQGYPTNTNLTLRETNWLNAGRVPDNQNFAILEIGCTVRVPMENPENPSPTSIFAALSDTQKAYLAMGAARQLPTQDVYNIAYGTVLEMSFLTNNVPIGLVADFSQSGGIITQPTNVPYDLAMQGMAVGPANGVPAAAFRRKLKVPILLSSGENMGMRLVIPRDIQLTAPSSVASDLGIMGCGWFEIRVDWWAIESFVEKS
jgi:hypothetical protein